MSTALRLGLHFMLWSLLSVGGALGLLGDMQRYLILEHHWLAQADFNAALALAQACPGPNIFLFAALLGWRVAGRAGAAASAFGLIVPSTLLACTWARISARHPEQRWLQAVRSGLEPVTVGLLLSSGWLLARNTATSAADGVGILIAASVYLRSSINPLWLLGAGAIAGAAGWI